MLWKYCSTLWDGRRTLDCTHLGCSGVFFIQAVVLFVLLLVLLVVLAELPAHGLDVVLFHHLILRTETRQLQFNCLTSSILSAASFPSQLPPHLLEFGDGIQKLDVQLGVVLSQRLVAIVVDELHNRAEGQRVREAVLPIPVEYLNELVVAPFPVDERRR